jgi:hypothetical protein
MSDAYNYQCVARLTVGDLEKAIFLYLVECKNMDIKRDDVIILHNKLPHTIEVRDRSKEMEV